MEFKEIYKDCIYSVKFDNEDLDEYSKAFQLWKDIDYLVDFFKTNAKYIDNPIWQKAGLSPETPNDSAKRVAKESVVLAGTILNLVQNSMNGETPDLEDFFVPLEGKYSFVSELTPHKAYGTFSPSLLRLYAIKLEENAYLIVCGGIKLAATIQESPGLKETLLNKIDNVLSYMKSNGITELEDF